MTGSSGNCLRQQWIAQISRAWHVVIVLRSRCDFRHTQQFSTVLRTYHGVKGECGYSLPAALGPLLPCSAPPKTGLNTWFASCPFDLFGVTSEVDHWQPCLLFAGKRCGVGKPVDQYAGIVLPLRVEHSYRSRNAYTNKSSTTRPCTSVMRKSRPLCR